eukprot:TRINITY_DN410_c0_g1_i1.p1 TRINITY_DN410_c0_g1~~TRINITY_DN410_c0_g1_i1.p1  ORF type:complete len:384 (+),score=136.88 TRINITY_DN410_c0_g1_i1:50-1201(+)
MRSPSPDKPQESQQEEKEEKHDARASPTPTTIQQASSGVAGISLLGWVSLGCLVFQNSSLTLTMRASRLSSSGEDKMYLATSAVVIGEAIKVMASTCLLVMETGSVEGAWAAIYEDILSSPMSNMQLLIPAGLYTLQNNIQYYAASNLDPATFQVLYQMKLVTTAILSVILLKKKLSKTQWISILILTLGIALVQTSQGSEPSQNENQFMGFVAVFIACCTSACAGVYLEKIVKQTKASVWIRNIQLASFGLVVGLFGSYAKDREAIMMHGFLQGFEPIVWVVIFLASFGGILIAVVVKYADNIMKGFATGLAIIISALASVVLFNFVITAQYVVGAAVVIASVYLYSVNNACSCLFPVADEATAKMVAKEVPLMEKKDDENP